MYLFNYPPYQSYGHLNNPKREKITVLPVEKATPLGESFTGVVSYLGVEPVIDLLYFPTDYQGQYLLESKPNSYFYQILGAAVVEGHSCVPGDLIQLTGNNILVQSSPYAPCVFAHIAVKEPTPQADPFEPHELSKQIMVVDYIDAERCEKIINSLYPHENDDGYGKVLTNAKDNKTEKNLEVRKTNVMRSHENKLVKQTLEDVIINCVEPFYKQSMEFWNTPVLLKYETGGFFVPHVDSEMLDPETQSWYRIYDRDYTLVCFLNDDYEGGVLTFPDLNFSVPPKRGRVVAFLGDHRYRHGAELTTSGTRYQLVSWLTAYGTPRTNIPPNPSVIYRTW